MDIFSCEQKTYPESQHQAALSHGALRPIPATTSLQQDTHTGLEEALCSSQLPASQCVTHNVLREQLTLHLPVPRNFTFWTSLPHHVLWAILATWTKGRRLSLCIWSGWMVRELDRGRPQGGPQLRTTWGKPSPCLA